VKVWLYHTLVETCAKWVDNMYPPPPMCVTERFCDPVVKTSAHWADEHRSIQYNRFGAERLLIRNIKTFFCLGCCLLLETSVSGAVCFWKRNPTVFTPPESEVRGFAYVWQMRWPQMRANTRGHEETDLRPK